MTRRALLTDGERAGLRGEADVENPEQYQSKMQYRVKQRLDRLEEDIAILRDHAPEVAEEVDQRVCGGGRLERLERQVNRLREQVDADANETTNHEPDSTGDD